MTDYHSIRCPVCLHPFDATKHVPKVFPRCGHTICQECLMQVLKTDEPRCPMDKLRFGRDFRHVEAFPTNFLGKDLLEIKGKWHSCQLHNENKEFICLDDHSLVCGQCVIFGDHKGHQIKRLSDYQVKAKAKKVELQRLAKKIVKGIVDVDEAMEQEQKRIAQTINKRFQLVHADLQRHETDLQGRLTAHFLSKRSSVIVKKLTIDSAALRKLCETKLKEFDNIMSNSNIVNLFQEDFSDISKQIDEKLISPSEKFIKELNGLSIPFENALPPQNFLKDLNVKEKIEKELRLFTTKPVVPIQELDNDAILVKNAQLEINTGMFSQIMNIQPSYVEKSYTFKASDLSKIKGLSFKISKDQRILNENVISQLSNIAKKMTNTESVSIELLNPSEQIAQIDQNLFLNLVTASFSFPKNIKHIYFNVKNANIGDQAPLFIIDKALPLIQDLKSFCFISHNSGITTSVLKALSKENLSKRFNLEKFRIQFSGATLEEQDVIQFLSQTPDVKDLSLRFENTALEDQWLYSFSANVLPSLNKVQRLEIGLSNTDITDKAVQKLLQSVPNDVVNLLVGLENTIVTNTALQEFLDTKISTLKGLKDLELNISNTSTSNDMSDLIRKARQKVISSALIPSSSFVDLFGKKISAFA